MSEKKLQKLDPYCVYKIWGGDFLSKFKSIDQSQLEPLGETWEVSNLKGQSSTANGKKLSEICSKDALPYLVKFLDTSDALSIQVHPDDEYSSVHENSLGKSECWLILESKKEAGIYLGFKDGVGKKELLSSLEDEKDISQLLNFHPVEKGDFFFVPAGTVHAIGAGITLCEVQQSSGVTYRLWDWNRKDSNGVARELHIEHSMNVLNFNKKEQLLDHFQFKTSLFKKTKVYDKIRNENTVDVFPEWKELFDKYDKNKT